MQVHQLKPKHKLKGKKIVGRGGKKGTSCGKGNKGQSSRAGRKMAPIIREFIKRYPKLRGYRTFVLEKYIAVVNLDTIDKNSNNGEVINPENLVKKGIIRMVKGRIPKVKILGKGKIDKKLFIENCKVSVAVKKAIEEAGGSIK